jgi:RNA polymerase sigma-70 factor (ECF subfamily)
MRDGVFSDEALALQLQQGRQMALTTLVERHYDPLLGYLYRLVSGDRALAEDLIQETFLRVLGSIGQYQHPRPFKPWLYAIATNLARNHYKRADTRRTLAAGDDGVIEDEWEAPEAALLAQDEVQTVIAALASLPDEQREVIVLYYYQSLEGGEIAAALGIPLGTVRSRLAAGVRRLRRWMEEKAT